MSQKGRTITVWDCRARLDYWGHIAGPAEFQSADVSLDEAADLADDLLGGPLVAVCVAEGFGWVVTGWRLWVRGFTEVDTHEALYAAETLLAGRLPSEHGYQAHTYRLTGGELVPVTSPG